MEHYIHPDALVWSALLTNTMIKIILLFAITMAKSLPYKTRDIFQSSSMIYYMTNRLPQDYDNYGCWCGENKASVKYVDKTDLCCLIHYECYNEVNRTYLCDAKLTTYSAKFNSGTVTCIDDYETCAYDTCMCDKRAAECFKRHLLTYNNNFKHMSEEYCQTTDGMHFDTLQRAPKSPCRI
ncbi:unnamed protein product [Didymodactylos carnosus]|uniref:Phospholipase A2 n=1 Tax=Didymodactylos carnosus TaxID=1234261 RepID=A0A814IAK3_9BILA|nr:unnamed protein product [Didymodactylos carnosus]CAF3792100.1 unnamed protein product [Didymodactylos carnosus]